VGERAKNKGSGGGGGARKKNVVWEAKRGGGHPGGSEKPGPGRGDFNFSKQKGPIVKPGALPPGT